MSSEDKIREDITADSQYSSLYHQLDSSGKARYKEKLRMLKLQNDPYLLDTDDWSAERSLWPPVEFPDLFIYLINLPSPYTKEALKAYKSTDAWSYFVSGFVNEVKLLKITEDSYIMTAKVCTTGESCPRCYINIKFCR